MSGRQQPKNPRGRKKERRTVRTCGKRRFRDHSEAVSALQRIDAREGELAPVRAYECDRCHGWHLTSQAR